MKIGDVIKAEIWSRHIEEGAAGFLRLSIVDENGDVVYDEAKGANVFEQGVPNYYNTEQWNKAQLTYVVPNTLAKDELYVKIGASVTDNRVETWFDDLVITINGNEVLTYYEPQINSTQEYYPFGSIMPGRSFNTGNYRYGFNGQEKDDELKGSGNSYDFGARIYDSRIGRFLSVDPKTSNYSWQAPYAYHRNSPIVTIDFQGEGDPPEIINGVYFVKLKNPTAKIIYNKGMQTFTKRVAGMYNDNSKNSYSVNLQQYGYNNLFSAGIRTVMGPTSGSNPFHSLGKNVSDGVVSGREPEQSVRAYASQDNDGNWSFGLGAPPTDAKTAFGGGIPIILNGELYGEGEGQTNPEGYANQNALSVGKVLVGFNSKTNTMMLVVSPDELSSGGMTLDLIRDKLSSEGYDNLIGFDGGSSSTLIEGKNNVMVKPDKIKDNTIPTGLKVEGD